MAKSAGDCYHSGDVTSASSLITLIANYFLRIDLGASYAALIMLGERRASLNAT